MGFFGGMLLGGLLGAYWTRPGGFLGSLHGHPTYGSYGYPSIGSNYPQPYYQRPSYPQPYYQRPSYPQPYYQSYPYQYYSPQSYGYYQY